MCVCMCMYVDILCGNECVYMHMFVHMYVRVCECVCVFDCVQVCGCVCIYVCMLMRGNQRTTSVSLSGKLSIPLRQGLSLA